MSMNRWMDKEVVHIHNDLSYQKEHIWVSSNEVDESRMYYRESSKSEREREISYTSFPCGSAGSVPGLGRSPGEAKGYPLQYSGLENSMDCIVHGVTKSWTRLSNFHVRRLSPIILLSPSTASTGGKKRAEDWIHLGECASWRRAQFGKEKGEHLGLHTLGGDVSLVKREERAGLQPFMHPDSGSRGRWKTSQVQRLGGGSSCDACVVAVCLEDPVTLSLTAGPLQPSQAHDPGLRKHLHCWLQTLKFMIFKSAFPKLQLYFIQDFEF